MHLDPVSVRPRAADDVPHLVRLLGDQQAGSGYPVRWPLPYPTEEFVVRATELAAWVAEVDGRVVGHVSLLALGTGWDTDAWVAGTGLEPSAMAAVGVLFVDPARSGLGIGSRLLTTAVEQARALGRLPVLDVVQESQRAVALYRRHGWQEVGRVRPPWLPEGRLPLLLMALPAD